MLITFIRAIILYVVVLIIMRLMGKREIGQLQPFELAISIMIADLASVPMSELRNTIIKWNSSNFCFTCSIYGNINFKYEKCKY